MTGRPTSIGAARLPDRRHLQAFHPFARLNRLLAGIAPGGGGAPAVLSIGEPQNQPPAFVAEELARAAAGWSRYPPPRGTPDYLDAAAGWLCRRFALPEAMIGGMIDPARQILPLPGSREGLFFAALATIAPAEPGAPPPAMLIPDPFYHVYAGAAVAAGAEPIFVPATAATAFQPDYGALAPDILARAALAIYCSPGNPQGMAASQDELESLIRLARDHDFILACDECYTEIYTDRPPAGALQAAAALGGGLENLLIFHSLSKRSSAAGLRCGFVVGAPEIVDALDAVLRVGGAGVPLPTLAAGAALWRDDAHVEVNRRLYRTNFDLAGEILGTRFGYRRPDGGFFLWLEVGDGEAAALRLWRDHGIKVLPGAYMSQPANGGAGPGAPYIRVALVQEPETMAALLKALVIGLEEASTLRRK